MILRNETRLASAVRAAAFSVSVLALATAAGAADGGLVEDPEDGELRVPSTGTYYAEQLEASSWRATAEAGMPSRLHVAESDAFVEYRALHQDLRRTEWEVRVRNYHRRHESVDAVYDMILVLPLPEDASGDDAFAALDPGIALYEGDERRSAPALYGGREVVLKRNLALERTLLPGLMEGAGTEGKLPNLAGTGYRYTCWDAVVAHDAQFGDSVRGWASLRYGTDGRVTAPDADDDRLSAYWITWIPSLTTEVRPYAVRIDVRD